MKKRIYTKRQAVGCILGVFLICALAVISPLKAGTVHAELDERFSKFYDNRWVVEPVDDDNYTGWTSIYIDAVMDGAEVTKVKSSNKKVAKVKADANGLEITYGVRTGSTTISCDVNGVKLSHKFTVKYTCPASVFKVNGKSALSVLKKKNVFVTKKALKNKKVKVKAKKGWVITEVTNTKKGKGKTKAVKNKTSYSTRITTSRPYDGIRVKFKNKKTGEEQTMTYRKYYDSRNSQAG